MAAAVLLTLGACGTEPGIEPAVRGYSSPVVLFVGPDPAELARMEAEAADAFHTMADDEMWYRAAAYPLLDSLGLRYELVERAPMRFRVRGQWAEHAWREREPGWFVVVYDGTGEPRVTASVDLPREVGRLGRR